MLPRFDSKGYSCAPSTRYCQVPMSVPYRHQLWVISVPEVRANLHWIVRIVIVDVKKIVTVVRKHVQSSYSHLISQAGKCLGPAYPRAVMLQMSILAFLCGVHNFTSMNRPDIGGSNLSVMEVVVFVDPVRLP